MSRVVIGILAGMGPRTTSPFLDEVLELCRRRYGAVWDEDFPDIVVYSLPAPFRPDRPPDRAAMEAALRRGAAALARAGAQLVAVPCNVVHVYFETIRAAAGGDVLHIVEETLKRLPAGAPGSMAVLATRALAASRLYHAALEQQGWSLLEEPELQDRIDELIARFKADGVAATTLETWARLRMYLETAGVTHVVLACTDLAFCATAAQRGGLQIFNSSTILAEALVDEFCRREGLRQASSPEGKPSV
jgi:aspartate racemase